MRHSGLRGRAWASGWRWPRGLGRPGGGEHKVVRNRLVAGKGESKVALVVAGGDEAYGAAGIQQGVDRADRLAAVVGEDDHVARRAGELGSAGHRAHLGELAVKGALCGDGDAVKAAHGGKLVTDSEYRSGKPEAEASAPSHRTALA